MKEFIYSKLLMILRILLGVFIILTISCFWYNSIQSRYDKEYLSYAADLRVLIEKFVRDAYEAVINANENSFVTLKNRKTEFSNILDILKFGKRNYAGNLVLPPSKRDIQEKELFELSKIWEAQKEDSEFILKNQDVLTGLHANYDVLFSSLQRIQALYLDIIKIFATRKNVSGSVFLELGTQLYLTNQLINNINDIFDIKKDTTDLESAINKKLLEFEMNFREMKSKYTNDSVYPKLLEIEKEFTIVKDHADDISKTGQTLEDVYEAWKEIYALLPKATASTEALEKAYAMASDKRLINRTTALILSMITFLILMAVVFLVYKEKQYNLKTSEEENRMLENEIQNLVYELKGLAEGDLSIQVATPPMSMTTEIARTINYAINALKKLVLAINQTSNKVTNSAVALKKITQELTSAMNQQSDQIINTGTSVAVMAASIDQVSAHAKKSARVAEESLDFAHEGAEVVQNTIAGMERIREQIGETEKRINRLHDSSQEIGEIVSLIDDIAEQTNILSLNASIQAAMAGSVGMGFAVVADEVQQLAVKSSEAAKEVETIVKAIRLDTNRASESMERAITEVTNGTNLANNAGRSLAKIETVSKNLAELIQEISVAAEEQAKVSLKISKMMEVIESIAKQTVTGTENTANSIDNLAFLVNELHDLVTEFKLPSESNGK